MKQFARSHTSWVRGLMVLFLLLTLVWPSMALASLVNESVVDTIDPSGSVTLTPGGGGPITINLSITGNQAGTATFQVYRDWTLSGGTFTGSNAIEFTVLARAATDPATTFSTSGTITIASGQAAGTFTLSVGAFNITNSNTTGAKLNAGLPSNYQVTVTAPPADTTPPSLTVPADMIVEATSAAGAVVTYSATATDNVDGSVTPVCTPASGSTFALGDTTVSCTATDAHGNTATASFKVTVRDTTPPTISGMPSNMTVEATGPTGATATWTAPTATDLVDGSVAVICTPASGSTFSLGTTTVSCSATDAHGNSATKTFNVTVRDTTPPSLTVPSDITVEATSAAGAVVPVSATATDVVDGSITPVCTPSGSKFPLGTTNVTCTATDSSGNTASGSFKVTVVDTTPPAISGMPSNITKEATGPTGATATWTAPTANDIVDGAVSVNCSPASGSTFALGDTTVTCTATDAHGNTATATFKVTVQDTTPPTISVPSDIKLTATIGTGGTAGAVGTWAPPTANDLVDGSVPVSCSAASGSWFAPGMTTVTCTATDAHGNKATASFKVTVNYRWDGFLQPINDTAHQIGQETSIFKFGSTVPVKFQLKKADGTPIQSNSLPVWLAPVKGGPTSAAVDEGVYSDPSTTGNTFRWDATSQQYIFNWNTKSASAGFYYRIGVQLDDDQTYYVNIGLR